MTLTSGNIPYDYVTALPIRVGITGGEYIGISGIFYEQAGFVLLAEARRFEGVNAFTVDTNPRFAKYTEGNHDLARISPHPSFLNNRRFIGSGYNPSNTDTVLVDDNTPIGGAWFIDYIMDLRYALERQCDRVATDMNGAFSTSDIKRDWLMQLYPNSPSGNLYGEFLHRSPFATITESGIISDLSLDFSGHGVLGGSGVLYDIDIGEVMYQPYPYLRPTTRERLYRKIVSSSQQAPRGIVSPFFPGFHKSDGTTLAVNSRHNEFQKSSSLGFGAYEHFESGVIKVDGDVLQDGTQYLIAEQGSVENPSITSHLTHVVNGARRMDASLDIAASQYGRAYITPSPHTAGVFSVIAKNPKSTFPKTAVESGQISIGTLEVYDDCFAVWVGSGLAIVSPFTGNIHDVIPAEQTLNPTTSSLQGTVDTTRSWYYSSFIDRIGSTVYSLLGTSLISSTPVMLKPVVNSFDDTNLDNQAVIAGDTFNYAASIDRPNTVGWWTDGSDFYASYSASNTSPKIFKFIGTALGLFEPATGPFGTGYHPDIQNGANSTDTLSARYIDGKHLGFAITDNSLSPPPSPSGTAEITFDDTNTRDFPPVLDYPVYKLSNRKELKLAPQLVGLDETSNFNTLLVRIIDIREITGGININDGIWFLVEVVEDRFTINAIYRYYFVRVTDSGSAWETDEVLQINGVKGSFSDEPALVSFLHLSIP